MKKFTFFIYFLLISIALTAQEKNDLILTFQKMQKQYSETSGQLDKANKIAKRENSNRNLKSDVISQKLDSTVNQVYNELGEVWQKDYKDEFLYDQDLKNTDWIEDEWDGSSGTWSTEFKAEMDFNNDGLVSTMLWYEKDTITKILVESAMFKYFYNTDNLPDSVSSYLTIDEGVTWDLMATQSHQYNASKQLIITKNRVFDFDEGALVPGPTTNYSYTTSGKIQNSVTSFLFEGSEYETAKSEYYYDGSDKLTTIEYYGVDLSTFVLQKSDRDSFLYNANGDVSIQFYSSWNGAEWMDEFKDEFEYTTTNFSEIAFPVFYTFGFVESDFEDRKYSKAIHMINGYEKVNDNVSNSVTNTKSNSGRGTEGIDDDWKQIDISTYYYSSGSVTGVDDLVNSEFMFYPNPVFESVTFNWKNISNSLVLKMYNITGALVKEKTVWSGKEVSISDLNDAVYLFKLMDGQQVIHSGKMVKN